MMKTVITLIIGTLLGSAGAWLYIGETWAEPDQMTRPVSGVDARLPDLPEPYYRVLFENEAVRVVEHRLANGEREPEHTHPPMVAYFVEGATLLISEADGSTSEKSIPTGAFVERPKQWTHSLENIGDTPLHSILVEFKTDPVN